MEKIILEKYGNSDENIIKEITEPDYFKVFAEFAADTVSIISASGSPVGWLHLSLPKTSLHSGFVFIYITPEHRRKGIGTFAYRHAEKLLKEIGCNWWSSYPESEIADKFALSVGFDYTNTNSYLLHSGSKVDFCTDGIRVCGIGDYPTAPDIWSKEYAEMHVRIGIPYKRRELSENERKEEYERFCREINNHFVIEIDGKIVGTGTLFSDNSGIGSLAVDRAYSGKGYGTRLAAFLTNECISRGCKNPCIYCETGNDNAMHVYKKIGYVEKSRESIAIKN